MLDVRIMKTPFCTHGDFQDLTGIIKEENSGRRQLYAAGAAVKKFYIQLILKGVDLVGYCRLGNAQFFGCSGKIQGITYGQKAVQLKGIHDGNLLFISMIDK